MGRTDGRRSANQYSGRRRPPPSPAGPSGSELLAQTAISPDEPARALQTIERIFGDNVVVHMIPAVALSGECSPSTLRYLAAKAVRYSRGGNSSRWQPSKSTLVAVAGHNNTPPDVFLATLENQKHIKDSSYVQDDPFVDVAIAMANNPICPMEALRQLATYDDSAVQRAVARHPHCPPQQLEQLATHKAWPSVRRVVASNPNTPVATLEHLMQDSDPATRQAAINNPRLPRATLAMWQLTHEPV